MISLKDCKRILDYEVKFEDITDLSIINKDEILLVKFVLPGGMGDNGTVTFLLENGKGYRLDYLDSTYKIDDICHFYPQLGEYFDTLSSQYSINLGMGNTIHFCPKYSQEFIKLFKYLVDKNYLDYAEKFNEIMLYVAKKI